MNKFCFGAIYNGRLWEKELRVSAQHKIAIYMAAVPEPIQIYTRLPCVHIKSLFTRQSSNSQLGYTHCCRVYTQNRFLHGSRSRAKSALYIYAGCIHYIKLLFTRQPFKGQIGYIHVHCCRLYIHKIVIYTAANQEPIQHK